MIATKKPDEIWADFEMPHDNKMPEGAITIADVMKRYGLKHSSARCRLNKVAESEGWVSGWCKINGKGTRYVVKDAK